MAVPSKAVAEAEDEIVAKNKTPHGPSLRLSDEYQLPPRPSHGRGGEATVLHANCFEVKPKQNLELHRYSVTCTTEISSRKRRRALELLFEHSIWQNTKGAIATDYAASVVTADEIHVKESGTSVSVDYYDEGESGPGSVPSSYTFLIRKLSSVSLDVVMDYLSLQGVHAKLESPEIVLQALNLVLARKPSQSDSVASFENKHFPHAGFEGKVGPGVGMLIPCL